MTSYWQTVKMKLFLIQLPFKPLAGHCMSVGWAVSRSWDCCDTGCSGSSCRSSGMTVDTGRSLDPKDPKVSEGYQPCASISPGGQQRQKKTDVKSRLIYGQRRRHRPPHPAALATRIFSYSNCATTADDEPCHDSGNQS